MWIKIAYACFVLNFAYGILAKTKVINTARFKVVHHIIYFCVIASLIIALLMEYMDGKFPVLLLITAALLLGMTQFSGKTRRHWQYALVCFFVYSAVLIYYL
ncbi:MAG: hypothetical protein D0433_05425 [Candidatus Thermochlorobacter aerophilum]|jgi:cytochrome b561|uniref:DUF3325 domain-containing protein n=1 Tax=Candidatus Thermochlorobacter aerophilus TaxID=1868324 RepID=A0A395M0Y4_9BACT|nr:MAG: hypothetical protein D0433_05425 [Candidatus Thermochlorobacter aerophilum]